MSGFVALLCSEAVDFTTEHLGTGFSYSADFSGITSLAWLCLHFEVTKLYMNNKTLSPLLHCLQGAVWVPPPGSCIFLGPVLFCCAKWVFIFSVPGSLGREAALLICSDGHSGEGGQVSIRPRRKRTFSALGAAS